MGNLKMENVMETGFIIFLAEHLNSPKKIKILLKLINYIVYQDKLFFLCLIR